MELKEIRKAVYFHINGYTHFLLPLKIDFKINNTIKVKVKFDFNGNKIIFLTYKTFSDLIQEKVYKFELPQHTFEIKHKLKKEINLKEIFNKIENDIKSYMSKKGEEQGFRIWAIVSDINEKGDMLW